MHSDQQSNIKTVTATPNKGVIALVGNLAWSIYNFRLPVIRALHQAGYKIVVIAPVDESVSALMHEPGIEFIGLQSFRRNSVSITASLRMIHEFKTVYQALKPDVVIHYGVQANIWGNLGAWLAKIPSVCVVTGLGYTFLHRGIIPFISRWLYRFSFLKTEKVVFENQEDLDLMVAKKMIHPSKTLRVPGCGIDTTFFSPLPKTELTDGPVFTLLGRLLYDKGLREFAAAAGRLRQSFPAAQCWVLGHLDDENPAHIQRNELISWVQKGFIHYKGATDDVRPIIAQSDWIVLPSYREGLSKVLLEAMAMGKPLITTDTPGCKETVVPGKTGYIVPIKDAEALYQTMLNCCTKDLENQHIMGMLGREKAIKEYDASIVGQLYLKLITTIQRKTSAKQ
jgi:glycosyltransferase involved in cell wall biosynthesis